MGIITQKNLIWFVILIGLILRLISLNQSLWLDEAISTLAVKNYSLLDLITQYAKADFHPPGWLIILWLWGKLFGYSEIAVRLPSVIFGVITIYITYLIGKKLVSRNLGLIAALLISVNPLHVYYSQEARMYSFATFAVILNFYYFQAVLVGKPLRWTLVLSNLLVLLSDYLAYLIFPAQLIIIFLTRKTQFLKTWLISLLMAALSFIWWIPIFLDQLNVGQATVLNVPAWRMVVGESGIKPLILTYVKFIIGRISISDNLIYGLVFTPVGILFAFLIWQGIARLNRQNKILILSWIGIPIILAWIISFVAPVYSYFRLLFVLPAFVILVVLGISTFKSKIKYLFLSLVILTELISLSTYLFNPIFQREDWKGLVKYLKLQPTSSKILFESNGSFAPFEYYSGNELKGVGALKNFPAKDLGDLGNLADLGPSVYLIDYLVEISDPNRLVSAKLQESGYKQADIKNFSGVGFIYHYIKQ